MIQFLILVISFLDLGIVSCAVDPLTKEQAIQENLRLINEKQLMEGLYSKYVGSYLGSCYNRSVEFKEQCTDQGVQESDCKVWECSDLQYTDQSSCEANHHHWSERDGPNTICCRDGRLECEDCCDPCLNTSHPFYSAYCTVSGLEGASVCGTTQGYCYHCQGATGRDSEGWCTSDGGNWSVNASATSEEACESMDACYTCVGCGTACPGDRNSCETSAGQCLGYTAGDSGSCVSNGGNWTPATWMSVTGHDEDSCNNLPDHRWERAQKWEEGDELPAAPMVKTECSTGPSHELDGLVELDNDQRLCLSHTKFLQDAAAGLTANEAIAADNEYYSNVMRSMLGNAVVTNHQSAVDRARITVESTACFMSLVNARNKGQVTVNGGENTYALVVTPTNYADADAIIFNSGNVSVLGGNSAGDIISSSLGAIKIFGVQNSGSVQVSDSQDIFIASVVNTAGASLLVTDVTATLISVNNAGTVTVKGPASGTAQGGKYKAYSVVNTGTIVIEAGDIEIELICPTSGSITLSEGVTGNITYESGCRGEIINASSGVTVQESTSLVDKVKGDLDVTVSDTSAFMADTIAKQAVVNGIADVANVLPSEVHATFSLARRRLMGRVLAAGTIHVDFTIIVPEGQTAADLANHMNSQSGEAITTAITDSFDTSSVTSTSVSAVGSITAQDAATTTTTVTTTDTATTLANTAGLTDSSTSFATICPFAHGLAMIAIIYGLVN